MTQPEHSLSRPEHHGQELVDQVEAARIVGVPDNTLQTLAEKGIIPGPVRINRKTLRWRVAECEAVRTLLPWLLELNRRHRRQCQDKAAKVDDDQGVKPPPRRHASR